MASITSAWLSLLKWGRAAGEGKSVQLQPLLSFLKSFLKLPAGPSQTMPTAFCLDLLQHKSFLKPGLQSSRLWGLPSS